VSDDDEGTTWPPPPPNKQMAGRQSQGGDRYKDEALVFRGQVRVTGNN